MNVRDKIQRDIFEETLRLFNLATAEGLAQSKYPAAYDSAFITQLSLNNAVFSAFRTHRMQNDIARQLRTDDGKLKSFRQWKEDIKGMTSHYVGSWLQTEYSTAVIRAHQAADWQHFTEEADVFPNVRWMPTTSPNQDPLHRQYWESRLTLPVNHPFWNEHRPGDRWNCKCTLMQTDEPANDSAIRKFYPVPQQPGLDNNPGKDGHIFSETHPYYTKAYPGAAKATEKMLDNAAKSTNMEFEESSTITEAETFAKQYLDEVVSDKIFKGKAIYRGISIENVNEINRALSKVYSTLQIEKIRGLKAINPDSVRGKKIFHSESDIIAAFDPINKGIYLNAKILKDKKSFREHIEKVKEAIRTATDNIDRLSGLEREIAEMYKAAGRNFVDDGIEGCIIHELGHHVQLSLPDEMYDGLSIGMKKQMSQISGYATSNKREYIAESFVSWMKGEKRIDYRLQEYLDNKSPNPPAKPSIWRTETTDDGHVRVNSEQSKTEIIENVRIAKYLAKRYNRHIDLIPNKPHVKSPDSFDRTQGKFVEYKSLQTPTENAFLKSLKKGFSQSDDLVVEIPNGMNGEIMSKRIYLFFKEHPDANSISLIKNAKTASYGRQDILEKQSLFTIKETDFN